MRKHYVTIVAAAALAGGWWTLQSWAAEPKPASVHHHITPEMEACPAAPLREGMRIVSQPLHACSSRQKRARPDAAQLNDCGDMCILAGKLVVRDGAFADVMCVACAKACDGCGAECGKFPNDEHMSLCAEACKDCATACRAMVKADGGAE